MIRRPLYALALTALVGGAASAGAASPSVIELCTSDALGGTGATAQLARLMSTARFESRSPPCEVPSDRRYLATFVARGSAVFLSLVDSGGMRLERKVPWLTGVERPLARLELEGRLVEFSLLLESLLAEARNPLPAFEPAPLVEAFAEPVPTSKSIGRKAEGAGGPRPRAAAKAATTGSPRSDVSKAGARAGGELPATGAGSGDGALEQPGTSGSSAASGTSAGEVAAAGGGAGPATRTTAAAASGPTSGERAGDGSGPASGTSAGDGATAGASGTASGEGAGDGSGTGAGESGAAHLADGSTPYEPAAEPFWSEWRLHVSGVGGLRSRSPGLSSPEAGLRVAFGPYWVRGTIEGEAEWDLGAPIRISAMSAAAGAEVPLFGRGAWGAAGLAGVGVDQLDLRRADFEGARVRRVHDVGPLAGFLLGWESGPVASSILVEAQWSPTARRIWLPEGTSGVLGLWSVRAGVTLGWKR